MPLFLNEDEIADTLLALDDIEFDPIPLSQPPPKRRKRTRRDNSPPSVHFTIQDTCAICLNEYKPLEKVALLPCRHSFHSECIHMCGTSLQKCPMCRGGYYEAVNIKYKYILSTTPLYF
jgi:hypothetical protein